MENWGAVVVSCKSFAYKPPPMRPRGGVVTQRTANPCIPVRFRARPPIFAVPQQKLGEKKHFHSGNHLLLRQSYSLIAQLVEHSTVNRMVAGSSPARGAILKSRFVTSRLFLWDLTDPRGWGKPSENESSILRLTLGDQTSPFTILRQKLWGK